MPALLRDAGCSALVKAVGYHAGQKQLPERLILLGKRCRDRELFRFFASDLQLKVWQALERVGGVGNACVTYVPRRRSAALQAGVDQGKSWRVPCPRRWSCRFAACCVISHKPNKRNWILPTVPKMHRRRLPWQGVLISGAYRAKRWFWSMTSPRQALRSPQDAVCCWEQVRQE
jgi:hypothetical protein